MRKVVRLSVQAKAYIESIELLDFVYEILC